MGASDFSNLPHIGEAVRRKEDYRFLTGAGNYTDDITQANQTCAVFVRSPHAHANIKSIDLTRAKAMPGVQKPHCRAWQSLNAACMGCMLPSGWARPSMVVISQPSACTASMAQDLMARPSSSTVQAPHWLVSQPTCVPVSWRCSRSACTSRVLAGASTLAGRPLTVNCTGMGGLLVGAAAIFRRTPPGVARDNPEPHRAA